MTKLRKLIEEKKVNKIQKYGIRKLSIGVVSCLLGVGILFAPSSVKAAEEVVQPVAIVEDATTESKETPVQKAVAGKEGPAQETVADKTALVEEAIETTVDETTKEEMAIAEKSNDEVQPTAEIAPGKEDSEAALRTTTAATAGEETTAEAEATAGDEVQPTAEIAPGKEDSEAALRTTTAATAGEETTAEAEATAGEENAEVDSTNTDAIENKKVNIYEDELLNKYAENECEILIVKKENSGTIDMKAKAVINGGVHSNVDYTKNRYNEAHDHTKPEYQKLYGPGELEFNHWKSDAEKKQNIRVNFGSEYNIDDAKLTVELPYENVQELIKNGKLTITNASEWLVTRLYANKSDYDTIDKSTIPNYEVVDNKLVFDLSNFPSRTAGSLQFHMTFDDQESYDNALANKEVNAQLNGTVNFENLNLAGNKTVYEYTVKPEKLEDIVKEFVKDTENNVEKYEEKVKQIVKDIQENKNYEIQGPLQQKEITNPDGTKNLNGYIVHEKLTFSKTEKTEVCDVITVAKEITDKVDLNAKSVMDTDLDNYPNNGYQEKVFNSNNHAVKEGHKNLLGPGNLEVQHWQAGKNEATTKQFWRIVFATDYAIENGEMVVELPYELGPKDSITDATEWLVGRYYPAVTGNPSKYSDLNKLTGENFVGKIRQEGNKLFIDLGTVPARSALSFIVTKNFDKPQDFSNDLKVTSFNVTGNWRLGYVDLPTTEVINKIKCGSCNIPTPPVVTPEKPPVVTPEKPPVVTPEKPPVVTPEKPPVATPVKTTVKTPNRPELPKTSTSLWTFAFGGFTSLIGGAFLEIKSRKNK